MNGLRSIKSLRIKINPNCQNTMNVNKSANNNKRKCDNEQFSCSDDEIQLLLEVTFDYKSTCEFKGTSWESKRRNYETTHFLI